MTSFDTTMIETATALADILDQENVALAALSFVQSASLASAKEHRIAAFNGARANQGNDALPQALARRLSVSVAENKQLLERAMYVQGQVIACIARAAPKPLANVRSYGRTGAWAGEARAMPIALAARI